MAGNPTPIQSFNNFIYADFRNLRPDRFHSLI